MTEVHYSGFTFCLRWFIRIQERLSWSEQHPSMLITPVFTGHITLTSVLADMAYTTHTLCLCFVWKWLNCHQSTHTVSVFCLEMSQLPSEYTHCVCVLPGNVSTTIRVHTLCLCFVWKCVNCHQSTHTLCLCFCLEMCQLPSEYTHCVCVLSGNVSTAIRVHTLCVCVFVWKCVNYHQSTHTVSVLCREMCQLPSEQYLLWQWQYGRSRQY